jgi:nucleotide-binding universal stress UspA family protein
MPIICGTDFSDRGRDAADIAALLAARSGRRLELVHALDVRGAVLGAAHVLQTLETAARERLDLEAERLRALGANVGVAMPDGWPDEAVLGEAERHSASLIVLAATGARDGAGVQVGKTCERSLSRTTVPMLVVRDPAPLAAWLSGERPLHVLVGFDFSDQSAAALRFAAGLTRLGACRIVAAYADESKRDAGRMGFGDDPQHAQQQMREAIAERIRALEPELKVEILVSQDFGDPAARLVHLAERETSDLIVSGTHQRGALARLFSGSVSLQLLREAGTNLLIVPNPQPAPALALEARPEVRRLLVATDLSEHGNRAMSYALSVAPTGAEVTVIHVMSPNQMLHGAYGRPSNRAFEAEHAEERSKREHTLQALLAQAGEGRSEHVLRCQLVEHVHAARAICEQAEQREADLVCLSTLGRTGLAAAVLGSTAQEVLRLCRRPLLLVPPEDRE